MRYQSIQFGWMISLMFAIVLIGMSISYSFRAGTNPLSTGGLLVVGGILFIGLLCFYRLKIQVRDKSICLIYGIGLIRIRIKPENITELKEVRTPLYLGLGIRFTPSGMLYNVQGSKAVKLTFTKGRKVRTIRIGTSEPQALMRAIKKEFI